MATDPGWHSDPAPWCDDCGCLLRRGQGAGWYCWPCWHVGKISNGTWGARPITLASLSVTLAEAAMLGWMYLAPAELDALAERARTVADKLEMFAKLKPEPKPEPELDPGVLGEVADIVERADRADA